MTTWVLALLAIPLGLLVGLVFGDPMPGVAFALGLLVGSAGSILVVRAQWAAPAGRGGATIDDADTGWAEFHRELARARRYDRQFAIVRFSVGGPPDPSVLTGLRNDIAASSRRTDRLWIDEDQVLLLLPEATQAATEAVLARIRVWVPAAVEVAPSVARFPEHGVTIGAMISAIYGSGHEDAPTPIAAVRSDPRSQTAAVLSLDAGAVAAVSSDDVAARSG
jgi:hypothetical protein